MKDGWTLGTGSTGEQKTKMSPPSDQDKVAKYAFYGTTLVAFIITFFLTTFLRIEGMFTDFCHLAEATPGSIQKVFFFFFNFLDEMTSHAPWTKHVVVLEISGDSWAKELEGYGGLCPKSQQSSEKKGPGQWLSLVGVSSSPGMD